MANRIYSETLHQLERKTGPSTVLRRVHEFVHDRLTTDAFYFTMAAVRFTNRGRWANFAAAVHPPAMLVSNGRVYPLESRNGILGCLAETAPCESAEEIELAPGDRFILYTDGLVEVFNNHEEMLGVDGLKKKTSQRSKRVNFIVFLQGLSVCLRDETNWNADDMGCQENYYEVSASEMSASLA